MLKYSKMKPLSKILLALYSLILAWLILFKFAPDLSAALDQMRSFNLVPFADFSPRNFRDSIYNFFIFIPLGLLLSVNSKRISFWQKLAVVFSFSFAAEATQYIFAIGATDITDVITNTLGGFVGLVLYGLAKKYVDSKKLDQFIIVVGAFLIVLFILFAVILLGNGLRYQSAH